MSEKLKTLLKITEISYLERFSTSFKNLSFLKTIKLFFYPKKGPENLQYRKKLKLRALLFASIVKLLPFL